VVGRRDADPRPPVEVWTGPAVEDAPHRVEVGARGARRTPLLVAAALVALLGAGLVLGGGDDDGAARLPREERDNRLRDDLKKPVLGTTTTRPRAGATTSSTTTTLVGGPVFPVATGAALLLSDSSHTWTWLDLDSGLRRDVTVETDAPYPGAVVPVRGGVVTLHGSVAEFVPLPAGSPVPLGDAEQLLRSGSPDTVWLLRTVYEGPSLVRSEAVLVDLTGEALTDVVRLPGGYPAGATDDALVLSRGGRTYLVGEDGVQPLAQGEALRSAGNVVVVLACDDEAVCAPELHDLETGRTRRLEAIPTGYDFGVSLVISDDGRRVAAVTYMGAGASLTVYDGAGRIVGTTDTMNAQSEPAWLPGGLGLVVPDAGRGVLWISERGGELTADELPALADQYGDFVYVIPR
jgi:hypothetical protein